MDGSFWFPLSFPPLFPIPFFLPSFLHFFLSFILPFLSTSSIRLGSHPFHPSPLPPRETPPLPQKMKKTIMEPLKNIPKYCHLLACLPTCFHVILFFFSCLFANCCLISCMFLFPQPQLLGKPPLPIIIFTPKTSFLFSAPCSFQ